MWGLWGRIRKRLRPWDWQSNLPLLWCVGLGGAHTGAPRPWDWQRSMPLLSCVGLGGAGGGVPDCEAAACPAAGRPAPPLRGQDGATTAHPFPDSTGMPRDHSTAEVCPGTTPQQWYARGPHHGRGMPCSRDPHASSWPATCPCFLRVFFFFLLLPLPCHLRRAGRLCSMGTRRRATTGEGFLRQLWAHVAQCTVMESHALGGGGLGARLQVDAQGRCHW